MSIKYTIHVYRCVDTRCRAIYEKEGMPVPSIRCYRCGKRMNNGNCLLFDRGGFSVGDFLAGNLGECGVEDW